MNERDAARRKLGIGREDEVFEYEFDFGDGWSHRCTVLEADVTPEDHYGVGQRAPLSEGIVPAPDSDVAHRSRLICAGAL